MKNSQLREKNNENFLVSNGYTDFDLMKLNFKILFLSLFIVFVALILVNIMFFKRIKHNEQEETLYSIHKNLILQNTERASETLVDVIKSMPDNAMADLNKDELAILSYSDLLLSTEELKELKRKVIKRGNYIFDDDFHFIAKILNALNISKLSLYDLEENGNINQLLFEIKNDKYKEEQLMKLLEWKKTEIYSGSETILKLFKEIKSALDKEEYDELQAIVSEKKFKESLNKAFANINSDTDMQILYHKDLIKDGKINGQGLAVYKDKYELEYKDDKGKKQVEIYDRYGIYSGTFKDNIRNDKRGLWITFYGEGDDFVLKKYELEWKEDKPNGSGYLMELAVKYDDYNKTVPIKTVYKFNTKNGIWNGKVELCTKEGDIQYTYQPFQVDDKGKVKPIDVKKDKKLKELVDKASGELQKRLKHCITYVAGKGKPMLYDPDYFACVDGFEKGK